MRRRRNGSTMLEAALWLPILFGILMGTVELARVSYTYYTLHKILYTLARYVGTQSGINFCDSTDATLVAAKQLALRGSPDDSAPALLPGLEAGQIEVRLERLNAETGALEQCDCSATGCDRSVGGLSPEWIVVSLPDGYPIQLSIPKLTLDAIALRPVIRVPHGGA